MNSNVLSLKNYFYYSPNLHNLDFSELNLNFSMYFFAFTKLYKCLIYVYSFSVMQFYIDIGIVGGLIDLRLELTVLGDYNENYF